MLRIVNHYSTHRKESFMLRHVQFLLLGTNNGFSPFLELPMKHMKGFHFSKCHNWSQDFLLCCPEPKEKKN